MTATFAAAGISRHAVRAGALALALLLCAGSAQAAKKDRKALYYLDRAKVEQLAKDFRKPPAAGSEQDKNDLAAVLDWQTRRTPQQCAAANSQDEGAFEDLFPGVENPFASTPPEAAAFFRHAGEDLRLACLELKNLAKRPRPAGTAVHPCIKGVHSKYSYPSRHAAAAMLYALILSDLLPEGKGKFVAEAEQAAQNRVIGGVHYPADLTAGQDYARLLYAELLKKENFRRDMDSLRKYLSK